VKNLIAALTIRFNDRLSQPARSAAGAVGQIERAQKMAAGASDQWNKGLDQLDGKLNRLASASLVTDGIARAGQAIIRPLRDGVAASAEFGRGMTGIGITAQMTDRQLQPLRGTILQTSSELGALPAVVQGAFASVLAEGVYKTEQELTAAGRSVARFQKLAATMRDPISGEEAGGLSAGLARSFNVSADRLDQANAMINRAAQRGGVSIGVQARFLPAQAAAMKGLGGNSERGLSDLLAATQVSKAGAGGSDQAANNLANLLGAITSPETLKNFAGMGVNLEKEIKAGIERGISPLETVTTVTDRLTKGGDQFRLGELFGDRQAREGIAALIQNIDEFRSVSADLRGSDTLAAYMADLDRALQGPAASFDRYQSGVARAGIATGTILAPAVSLAANALSQVANWMSKAGEEGSLLAKVAVWTVAGFAGIAVGAGAIGHAVVGVLGPLFIMRTLLGPGGLGGAAVKGGIANVIGLLGRARMAAIGFNLAMLANPVVLGVAAAVAAVALVAIVVRKYWQPIKAFFGGVGAALGEAFGPALAGIGAALAPMKPLWDGLVSGVSKFFGWIGRLMQPMQATKGQLDGATNAGRNFGRMLVFAFNVSPIGLFVNAIGRGIGGIRAVMAWRPMDTLRNAWAGVSGFFAVMGGAFRGFGRMLMQGLVNGIRSMMGAVAASVVGVAANVRDRFKAALGIRSPSRVFAGLGGDTMAGLTMGLDRGGRSAVARVAAIGGALVAAMPATGAAAGGYGAEAMAAVAPRAAATGRPAARGIGGGTVIERIEIHVTVQGGGSDGAALGRQIGRATATELRASLADGMD
jgi:hypothetical protein